MLKVSSSFSSLTKSHVDVDWLCILFCFSHAISSFLLFWEGRCNSDITLTLEKDGGDNTFCHSQRFVIEGLTACHFKASGHSKFRQRTPPQKEPKIQVPANRVYSAVSHVSTLGSPHLSLLDFLLHSTDTSWLHYSGSHLISLFYFIIDLYWTFLSY